MARIGRRSETRKRIAYEDRVCVRRTMRDNTAECAMRVVQRREPVKGIPSGELREPAAVGRRARAP